jgi:hypothetical protein
MPLMKQWAGPYLLGIGVSGSYAKGIAIRLGTDVDLFVSVSPAVGRSVKDLYWELFLPSGTAG